MTDIDVREELRQKELWLLNYAKIQEERETRLREALEKLERIADQAIDQATGPIDEGLVFDIAYEALKTYARPS